MSTYAKIENNLVTEYPLFEGDLENRFPDLKFPMDTHGTPIPEGYVKVVPKMPPENDFANRYLESLPELVDGVWTTTWTPVPLTEEERTQWHDSVCDNIRNKRNIELLQCDWTQLPDCPLTTEKKSEWSFYRQALRDITNQPGFPFETVWPSKPE